MLLRITHTTPPATELGFLLHKNPGRVHSWEHAFGRSWLFYPEVSEERCTVALLLDVDPLGLVRGRRRGDFLLQPYVNDRPYVASSFLSVALSEAFGTAMSGRCKERPELATRSLPFRVEITGLPCRGGEALLRGLFEPLGYLVETPRRPLDEHFPAWGDSHYHDVTLSVTCTLQRLLQHLYVLVPVLDNDKHYWVGDDEVDKLLRHAETWLTTHPAREQITKRYLRFQRRLTRELLSRLAEQEDPDAEEALHGAAEAQLERPISLAQRRVDAVVAIVEASGSRRIVDLGCGEGRYIGALLRQPRVDKIVGVDVAASAIERAEERLGVQRMNERQRARVELLHGSLTYRDARLAGMDAALAIEVIEHLEPDRVDAFTRNLLGFLGVPLAVVTTPNAEFNVRFEGLAAGKFRHDDHRFEWTRAQFRAWAEAAAAEYGYTVELLPVGEPDPDLGAPTQMAVFRSGAREFRALDPSASTGVAGQSPLLHATATNPVTGPQGRGAEPDA